MSLEALATSGVNSCDCWRKLAFRRSLSRNPSQGQELLGITRVTGDLAKPETLPAVFAGCTKMFLLTGNVENMTELQHNAIVAARQAGIAHVVKLSAFGASSQSNSLIGRWHYQVEKKLQESGLAWTILRPHHFMQNLFAQAENIITLTNRLMKRERVSYKLANPAMRD